MNILVTNDDGIHSPGVRRLAEAASKFGDVWVAAPACQCSGMSQKLTIFDPISIETEEFPIPVKAAWKIGGTPADCVKLAVTALMPVKPDYVFSGINKGYNAGYDICYSGTIGAAMEALLNDIPAMAFSQDMNNSFAVTDVYLETVIEELLRSPLSLREIWNVNIPGCPLSQFQGIVRDCSLASAGLFENFYEKLALETGVQAMQPGAAMITPDRVPAGTDIHAVLTGHISIGRVRCMAK